MYSISHAPADIRRGHHLSLTHTEAAAVAVEAEVAGVLMQTSSRNSLTAMPDEHPPRNTDFIRGLLLYHQDSSCVPRSILVLESA